MDEVRKNEFKEVKQLTEDLHNNTPFGHMGGGADLNRLNTYSAYLSAKSNEELLKSVKNYNRVMISFGILNLVLMFINLYLLFHN